MRYIEFHRVILAQAECCMVNFDLHPLNILRSQTDDAVEYAWIDPERSFWGDRMADFVCLEILKPLAEKEGSLAAYNRVAEKPVTGSREEQIRYAVALGYLALIMETEKYYRYTRRHFGWWRNMLASELFFRQAFQVLEKEGRP